MDAPDDAAAAQDELTKPKRRPRGRPPRGMRPQGRKRFRRPPTPDLPAPVAGAAAGLLVGLVSVFLVYLGLRGCRAVAGTSSCGGPGLLMLVVIIGLAILAGYVLLKFAGVGDAALVSFSAVMIVLTVVMVFFIDSVFSPWMWLVLPLLNAVGFALGAWLSVKYAPTPRSD